MDELLFGLHEVEEEDLEGDGEQECFEVGGVKPSIKEDLLDDKQRQVGDEHGEEISYCVVIIEYLICHSISEVIADDLHVGEEGVEVPVIDEVLSIDAALEVILAIDGEGSPAQSFELIVDGEDLHVELRQVVYLEVVLYDHVGQLGALHAQE